MYKIWTKVVLSVVLIGSSAFVLVGQSKNNSGWTADSAFYVQARVYGQASQIMDWSTAISALHTMLAISPSRSDLLDSLALAYYQSGQFVQAKLISETVTGANPKNLTMWLVSALSNEKLGLTEGALEAYESLYGRTADPFYLYQVILRQYELKRYGECTANVEYLLGLKELSEETITVYYNKQKQTVPIKAAVLNIKGVVALDLGNTALAKGCFQKALAILPNFGLAKGNLANVAKVESGDKKGSSKK